MFARVSFLSWHVDIHHHQLREKKPQLFLFCSSTMMMVCARPFSWTGTDTLCADWSGNARAFGPVQYSWASSFLWMKAWHMAIIRWWWRTITSCPILIISGNTVHFSTAWFFPFIFWKYELIMVHSKDLPDSWIETQGNCNSAAAYSSCCLSSLSVHPFLSCPANYPTVPIKRSRHLFARPFIFISTAATYQLAISRETVSTCAHVLCIQLTQPL